MNNLPSDQNCFLMSPDINSIVWTYTVAPSPSGTHSATAYDSAYSDRAWWRLQNIRSSRFVPLGSPYSTTPGYSGSPALRHIRRWKSSRLPTGYRVGAIHSLPPSSCFPVANRCKGSVLSPVSHCCGLRKEEYWCRPKSHWNVRHPKMGSYGNPTQTKAAPSSCWHWFVSMIRPSHFAKTTDADHSPRFPGAGRQTRAEAPQPRKPYQSTE